MSIPSFLNHSSAQVKASEQDGPKVGLRTGPFSWKSEGRDCSVSRCSWRESSGSLLDRPLSVRQHANAGVPSQAMPQQLRFQTALPCHATECKGSRESMAGLTQMWPCDCLINWAESLCAMFDRGHPRWRTNS